MEAAAVTSLRWIPLLPLLGALANGLFGAAIQRRAGKSAIAALAVAPGGSAVLLLLAGVFNIFWGGAAQRHKHYHM
jgi:hypothetical protein